MISIHFGSSIVPGGAAAGDGRIKIGDHVTGVGQETGEIEEVFDVKLSEVVRKIRGKAGTKVRLQVQHEGSTETVLVELVRKKIELKEQEVKGEIIPGSRVGKTGTIGVLSLPSFYRDFEHAGEGGKSAAVDCKVVLQRFNAANVDAVIVDLRNNGGGALTEAVEISGLFIDQGPVVQVKQGTKVQQLNDEDPGAICNKPVIVVCNRLSASASEIFAGVMKDYHRAIIVGDTTTHGKGTVQNLMDVAPKSPFKLFGKSADRGKLKLTIQQFYRVNGDSTQNLGVPSDVVLPSVLDHGDMGESFMENALPFDHIQQAVHKENRQYVTADLLAQLQRKSEQRVAADPEFRRVETVIQRYLERKNRKQISLNEEKLRAERVEDEKLKSEKEKLKEKEEGALDEDKADDANPNKPIFPKEYYNDELLNVTIDYVSGYNTLKTAKR